MGVGIFIPFDFPLSDIKYSLFFGESGSNQKAELAALTLGLAIARPGDIIFSDSKYALGMAGNWRAKTNIELVNLLREVKAERKGVALRWIRGHADSIGNQIADELAEKGRLRYGIDSQVRVTNSWPELGNGAPAALKSFASSSDPRICDGGGSQNGKVRKLSRDPGRCRDCGGLRPLKPIGREVGREGWYCRRCYNARYWTVPQPACWST